VRSKLRGANAWEEKLADQTAIIEELGVAVRFDAAIEVRRRVDFLNEYLSESGLRFYVLGISGGVDSLTAGLLAQQAARELRELGVVQAEFVAVRLPYGSQADETDAQAALSTINPDRTYTINIKPATDAMISAILASDPDVVDDARLDFVVGNVKARQRMIAQYTLAGTLVGLVIGTHHAAEAAMGFYTKFGDGAADILPLSGLNKGRVRALAERLGALATLVNKVPTADLETNLPLRPDEEVYGVTYAEIDDFLEGKDIDPASKERILRAFHATAHKRALPVVP
jgi:NAD+ synthase